MSSLTELLLSAQDANNAAAREAALKQIEAAERSSLEQFIGALMQELSDESRPQQSRQMAGLVLKNTMAAKSDEKRAQQAARWLAADAGVRGQVKAMALRTLTSATREVRMTAALIAATVARIELPQQQWDGFIRDICGAASQQGNADLREAALACVGWVCEEAETSDALRAHLSPSQNEILGVVVHAMRREETNHLIRLEGTKALANSLEFIGGAMQNKTERDFLMQVICEAASRSVTQDEDTREKALECLVKVGALYYDYLADYMQFIFTLTMDAVSNDSEKAGQQGIEFWTSIAETEYEIKTMQADGHQAPYQSRNFTEGAVKYIVDAMWACLQKQDEHADEDEWNLCAAAEACLTCIAVCVGDKVVPHVLPLLNANLNAQQSWRQMDAATSLFGAILDGTTTHGPLAPVWPEVVPALLMHMHSTNPLLKSSTAWCLGRIAEFHCAVILHPEMNMMPSVLEAMSTSLKDPEPRVAAKAAYTLLSIAYGVGTVTDETEDTNRMTVPFFNALMQSLLQAVDRPDAAQGGLRGAAWSALGALVSCSARDCFQTLQQLLLPQLLLRLQATFPEMQGAASAAAQQQVIETQGLVCALMNATARKLEADAVKPVADTMMQCFLGLFQQSAAMAQQGRAQVTEEVLIAIGAIAASIGKDFARYIDAFRPFLVQCLQQVEMETVVEHAVECLSDVLLAMGPQIAPHCDEIVTVLLADLREPRLGRTVKTGIVGCLGDIALNVGPHFVRYLDPVMSVVGLASQTVDKEVAAAAGKDDDLLEYQSDMREKICDAYTGVLVGLKTPTPSAPTVTPLAQTFNQNYVMQTLEQIAAISRDSRSITPPVHKAVLSLIEDLSGGFGMVIAPHMQNALITSLVQGGMGSTNADVRKQAQDTARSISLLSRLG